MWNKKVPVAPIAITSARTQWNNRLAKALATDSFIKQLQVLKGHIAMGYGIDECRVRLGVRSKKRWELLIDALGRLNATPEKLYIEFHTRAQARYAQILKVLDRCQRGTYEEEEFNGREFKKIIRKGLTNEEQEARMLLLLTKIDKQMVDLADRMGLLTMEHLPDAGEGISNEQVRKELEKIDDLIEAQIAARARACKPIAVGDESRDDDGRQADQMGPPPVDAHDLKR